MGEGHVYQGRFKSFPVETSEYLLTLCRYVERNPVRAGLVERAEQWRWSSAGMSGSVPLHAWPMERPVDWLNWVNEDEPDEQLAAVQRSVTKSQPFGSPPWVDQMVAEWNLGATLRERGRPKKELVNNGSLYLSAYGTISSPMKHWGLTDRRFHGRSQTECQRESSGLVTCKARTVARAVEPAFRKAGQDRRLS